MAGVREINKEYYKFNSIPLKKDAEASFFVFYNTPKLHI